MQHPRFGLFEDEGNARSWFGSAENFLGVATALTGTKKAVSQSLDNRLPCDVPPVRGLKQSDVIAFLDGTAFFETGLDGLLCVFDLSFELRQTTAQGNEQAQFQLGNLLRRGEWDNGEFRLRENF